MLDFFIANSYSMDNASGGCISSPSEEWNFKKSQSTKLCPNCCGSKSSHPNSHSDDNPSVAEFSKVELKSNQLYHLPSYELTTDPQIKIGDKVFDGSQRTTLKIEELNCPFRLIVQSDSTMSEEQSEKMPSDDVSLRMWNETIASTSSDLTNDSVDEGQNILANTNSLNNSTIDPLSGCVSHNFDFSHQHLPSPCIAIVLPPFDRDIENSDAPSDLIPSPLNRKRSRPAPDFQTSEAPSLLRNSSTSVSSDSSTAMSDGPGVGQCNPDPHISRRSTDSWKIVRRKEGKESFGSGEPSQFELADFDSSMVGNILVEPSTTAEEYVCLEEENYRNFDNFQSNTDRRWDWSYWENQSIAIEHEVESVVGDSVDASKQSVVSDECPNAKRFCSNRNLPISGHTSPASRYSSLTPDLRSLTPDLRSPHVSSLTPDPSSSSNFLEESRLRFASADTTAFGASGNFPQADENNVIETDTVETGEIGTSQIGTPNNISSDWFSKKEIPHSYNSETPYNFPSLELQNLILQGISAQDYLPIGETCSRQDGLWFGSHDDSGKPELFDHGHQQSTSESQPSVHKLLHHVPLSDVPTMTKSVPFDTVEDHTNGIPNHLTSHLSSRSSNRSENVPSNTDGRLNRQQTSGDRRQHEITHYPHSLGSQTVHAEVEFENADFSGSQVVNSENLGSLKKFAPNSSTEEVNTPSSLFFDKYSANPPYEPDEQLPWAPSQQHDFSNSTQQSMPMKRVKKTTPKLFNKTKLNSSRHRMIQRTKRDRSSTTGEDRASRQQQWHHCSSQYIYTDPQQLAATAYSLATRYPSVMLDIPCDHENPPCPSCIIYHCNGMMNNSVIELRPTTEFRLSRSPTARAAIVHYPHPPVPVQHLPRFRQHHQQALFDEFVRTEGDPMRVQLGHFIVEHCMRSFPDDYLRPDMTPDPRIVIDFVEQIIYAVEIFGEHAQHSRDSIPTDINENYISNWLQQHKHLLNPLEILHRRRQKRSQMNMIDPSRDELKEESIDDGVSLHYNDDINKYVMMMQKNNKRRDPKVPKTKRKIGVSLGEELDGLGVPRMIHYENLREAISNRGLVVQLPSNGTSCSSLPYLRGGIENYFSGSNRPSYYRYRTQQQPRLLFNLLIAGRGDTRRSKMELPWGITVKIKYNRTLLGIPDFVVEGLGYGSSKGHHLIPKVCAVSLEDSAYGVEVLLFYRGLPCSKRQVVHKHFSNHPVGHASHRSMPPAPRYHMPPSFSLPHQPPPSFYTPPTRLPTSDESNRRGTSNRLNANSNSADVNNPTDRNDDNAIRYNECSTYPERSGVAHSEGAGVGCSQRSRTTQSESSHEPPNQFVYREERNDASVISSDAQSVEYMSSSDHHNTLAPDITKKESHEVMVDDTIYSSAWRESDITDIFPSVENLPDVDISHTDLFRFRSEIISNEISNEISQISNSDDLLNHVLPDVMLDHQIWGEGVLEVASSILKDPLWMNQDSIHPTISPCDSPSRRYGREPDMDTLGRESNMSHLSTIGQSTATCSSNQLSSLGRLNEGIDAPQTCRNLGSNIRDYLSVGSDTPQDQLASCTANSQYHYDLFSRAEESQNHQTPGHSTSHHSNTLNDTTLSHLFSEAISQHSDIFQFQNRDNSNISENDQTIDEQTTNDQTIDGGVPNDCFSGPSFQSNHDRESSLLMNGDIVPFFSDED